MIDLTVFSPERLDYCAGAMIAQGAPFYQDRPAPELHAGIVLNLDALPDATDEERQEYAARLEAAKDGLRPSQRERVRQSVQAQAPALQGAAQEQGVTRRLLHAERGELAPAHPLEFPPVRSRRRNPPPGLASRLMASAYVTRKNPTMALHRRSFTGGAGTGASSPGRMGCARFTAWPSRIPIVRTTNHCLACVSPCVACRPP